MFLGVGGLFAVPFDHEKALVLLALAWILHLIGVVVGMGEAENE
jgi:hypothetical protein